MSNSEVWHASDASKQTPTPTELSTAEHLPVSPPLGRGLFCNRTLNLRAIRAIGYDMDYTLVHYRVDAWERRAYQYLQQKLLERGWPVEDLEYDTELVVRGLVIDTALGNIVKADRFGYVKRASHGTVPLTFEVQRQLYTRALVELSDPRWVFLNTFFSLSEACMYAQLVDRLDQQRFPTTLSYAELHHEVHRALDAAHAEGRLKEEIVASPAAYVDPDPDSPLTLLDQRESGKRLILITNSEWAYTSQIMSYSFNRFMPSGSTWRDLFEVVIVSARKPEFFSARSPLFEVTSESGLLRPVSAIQKGGVYVGGSAVLVEEYLKLSGSEILYVGDHLYTDVRVSKSILRWRTALVLRELERELTELAAARADQARLDRMMGQKERLEFQLSQARLQLQRHQRGYGPANTASVETLEAEVAQQRQHLDRLDAEIAPLATALSRIFNFSWGPLMRTGNDKSHLARQVERYADIYTSRVSNFLYQTPFAFLRSPRGSLPHDG